MSMQEWYTSQTPREQFIVAATAIVGIGALIYTFAYKPLSSGIKSREASVVANQRDLEWMKQQSPRGSGGGGQGVKPLDLSLIHI